MPTTITLPHLIVFAILIISNGWLIWWKTYMTKKGENKAMQEDIGKITREVESIKTDLSYLNTNKISFVAEQRKAIIEYYAYLGAYIATITNYESLIEKEQDVLLMINDIKNASHQHRLAAHKLDLFLIPNKDITITQNKLRELLSKIEVIITTSYIEVRTNLINIDLFKKEDTSQSIFKIRSLWEDNRRIMKQYFDNMQPVYKDAVKLQFDLLNQLREVLEESFAE